MILNRLNFTKYYTINLATYITLYNTYSFSIYLGLYYISLRGDATMVWDGTAFILWQGCMRQDCIHFDDKMAWDQYSSIFMTRWHETGLHAFLWQDCMRQDCVHFYDKIVWDRRSSIFMTSHQKTGTHPFLWQAIIRPVLIHFYVKPA